MATLKDKVGNRARRRNRDRQGDSVGDGEGRPRESVSCLTFSPFHIGSVALSPIVHRYENWLKSHAQRR